MDSSPAFQQISAKVVEFMQDKRKVIILIGVIVGFMLIGLVVTILAPGNSSIQSSNGTAETTPEPTKTIEEIVALTLAPPKPTNIPFIKPEDIQEHKPTPTLTPLPGNFFIPDGTHNDLTIRILQVNPGDTFDEVRLVSLRTKEERLLGFAYDLAPGDSAFFSNDFSQVIFLGGSKLDYQKVNVYSIQQNKITTSLTLDQMKQAIPSLQTNPASQLSSMMPSPTKTKVALSYGLTFNTTAIHPETQIIVINLINNKMKLLPIKGLVKQWKDEDTLEYEIQTAGSSIRETREVTITGI